MLVCEINDSQREAWRKTIEALDEGSRRQVALFEAKFDVLLYDLTSAYFETDTPREEHDKRQYGYSRDKRFDCRQVVIALIVTAEGFPLSYEVLAGNTKDSNTLSDFLKRIETRCGRAKRIWIMDRGIPTEESLEQMRAMGCRVPGGHAKGAADETGESNARVKSYGYCGFNPISVISLR